MPLYPRLKIKVEQHTGDEPAVEEVAEPAGEADPLMLHKALDCTYDRSNLVLSKTLTKPSILCFAESLQP